LIEKNKYKWEGLDEFTKKRKMSEFLGRKGFSWEVIEKILKAK
jgi:SOS response regulatory protein OraA/RecX